jgi:SAM-dependent methyltransferase
VTAIRVVALVLALLAATFCSRKHDLDAAPPAPHDPAHPPIDCPLAKMGIDPHHLKPFEDVEKYVAFLERPDRALWQKPDEVVAALGLAGGETVVDLGAGSGYFTFRLARALPRGTVIAGDLEPEMIRHLHHRTTTEGVTNVQVALLGADDPGVPPTADLVFVCDVLHHVPDRPAWLAKVAAAMKPGARLALIEFKEGALPEGPPESVKIPRKEVVELAQKAGLTLVADRPDLLPYQTFLVFAKAP